MVFPGGPTIISRQADTFSNLISPPERLAFEKQKQRLIVDVDSTEDPAHGKQEYVSFNDDFGENCFHLLYEGVIRGGQRGGQVCSWLIMRLTQFDQLTQFKTKKR